MKTVVGLHGAAGEDYVASLIEAGADEFFVGYVPEYWFREFGFEFSPNRRYFRATQVTDLKLLKRLCKAAKAGGAAISLAFNEHFVTPDAWRKGRRLIREASDAGATAIIVADPSVIPLVVDEFPDMDVHVSGDAGIYNAAACELFFSNGVSRVIFPRELPVSDMKLVVERSAGPGREFEAFVMGEPCVFDGARCFTEHGYDFGCDFCNYHNVKMLTERGKAGATPLEPPQTRALTNDRSRRVWDLGKCGLCAVPHFQRLGITHLKIPGRASAAAEATALVRRMKGYADSKAVSARGLLNAPLLCDSRTFCYYPELSDEA